MSEKRETNAAIEALGSRAVNFEGLKREELLERAKAFQSFDLEPGVVETRAKYLKLLDKVEKRFLGFDILELLRIAGLEDLESVGEILEDEDEDDYNADIDQYEWAAIGVLLDYEKSTEFRKFSKPKSHVGPEFEQFCERFQRELLVQILDRLDDVSVRQQELFNGEYDQKYDRERLGELVDAVLAETSIQSKNAVGRIMSIERDRFKSLRNVRSLSMNRGEILGVEAMREMFESWLLEEILQNEGVEAVRRWISLRVVMMANGMQLPENVSDFRKKDEKTVMSANSDDDVETVGAELYLSDVYGIITNVGGLSPDDPRVVEKRAVKIPKATRRETCEMLLRYFCMIGMSFEEAQAELKRLVIEVPDYLLSSHMGQVCGFEDVKKK